MCHFDIMTQVLPACTWTEGVFRLTSPVVGLHLAGRVHLGMDLAGCALALEFSSSFRGPLGVLPGAPKKKDDDGAEGIFGNAGIVWATALQQDPP